MIPVGSGVKMELEYRVVYQEVPNYARILVNTVMKGLEKINLPGDLSAYILIEDPKFASLKRLILAKMKFHEINFHEEFFLRMEILIYFE